MRNYKTAACWVFLGMAAALAALFTAAWVVAAPAQIVAPTAVITGADRGVPIRPILLDGRTSTGATFHWLVSPASAGKYLVAFDDGGQRAAFSAAIPGKYMVVLVVDQTVIAGHAITIVEGPQPDPFPDPDPSDPARAPWPA